MLHFIIKNFRPMGGAVARGNSRNRLQSNIVGLIRPELSPKHECIPSSQHRTHRPRVRSSTKEYLSALASGLFLLLVTSAPAQVASPGKAIPSAGLPAGAWTVISGLNIKGNYQLYGSAFNNTLLIHSTITGSLLIDGVQRVYIQGNTIGSIWMPGNLATDNVTIDGNEITQAKNDCIQLHDGPAKPTHVLIENNYIHDCGIGNPGNTNYHAIYDQVPDVTIQGNYIWNASSAISIRSSGIVQGNIITRVPFGGGIEYFSDHDAPVGSTLTLQGNVINTILTNSAAGLGSRRGLIVLGNGIGTTHRPVTNYNLSSNYLAVLNPAKDASGIYYDIYTQLALPAAALANNTLINLIPGSAYIGPNVIGSEQYDTYSHISQ
jgi:hypothetical protein